MSIRTNKVEYVMLTKLLIPWWFMVIPIRQSFACKIRNLFCQFGLFLPIIACIVLAETSLHSHHDDNNFLDTTVLGIEIRRKLLIISRTRSSLAETLDSATPSTTCPYFAKDVFSWPRPRFRRSDIVSRFYSFTSTARVEDTLSLGKGTEYSLPFNVQRLTNPFGFKWVHF